MSFSLNMEMRKSANNSLDIYTQNSEFTHRLISTHKVTDIHIHTHTHMQTNPATSQYYPYLKE